MLNLQIERLRKLPQHADESWQAALFRMPAWIEDDDGNAVRPWTGLCLNPQSGLVGLAEPQLTAERSSRLLLEAMQKLADAAPADGRPSRTTRIFGPLVSVALASALYAAPATDATQRSDAQPATIRAADFGAVPDDGRDDVRAVKKALAACRDAGSCRLVFEAGRYDFHTTFAAERYCFISNNDEGLKRIAFPLIDLHDVVIDGGGALFMFHGFINPFVAEDSTNIAFANFAIDFSRTFHSEAVILGYGEEHMDLEIRPGFPYAVNRGTLLFTEGAQSQRPLSTVSHGNYYGSRHMLEYDAEKRETAYMVKDFYFRGINGFPAQQLDGRKVRLRVPGLKGKTGNIMAFGPNHRNHPGFVVSDCADVVFRNVTIHHSGGMGILGQRSHNIVVERCKVTPSQGRMISTTADATHFVNCTGAVKLVDCLFENQKDDATNIHGIYAQIVERGGDDEIVLQLKHDQQHGFALLEPGARAEFVRGKSMIAYAEATVKTVERVNKEIRRVVFTEPPPANMAIGDALAVIRDYPEVTISGNTIRNNRARGMLLNCRGKTVVEDNYFHTPGAAILFEGDAFYWFEQGGVRDCVIRNNVFDNCVYGVWGEAVIDVKAGIREDKETSRYNRNIRIEGNTFRMYDDGTLLHAYCVDGLVWRNNKVERTDAYPPRTAELKRFDIEHCDNVDIQE